MWHEWDAGPKGGGRLSGLGKTADEAAVKAAVTAGGCLQEWKRQNRPLDLDFCSKVGGSATGGGLLAPVPGQVPTTLPAPSTQTPGTGAPATGTTPSTGKSAASGLTDFFSEIPSTYLFIGGAIVVFMMLKKR